MNYSKDAVQMVICNTTYNEQDYIRDGAQFNSYYHPMDNPLLSIILLSYQSETRLEKAVREISTSRAQDIPHEIIIIDYGSSYYSYAIAKDLTGKMQNVSAYQLARNYTSPMAQFAGLEKCKGQCACPVPDDGQRPMEHIIAM